MQLNALLAHVPLAVAACWPAAGSQANGIGSCDHASKMLAFCSILPAVASSCPVCSFPLRNSLHAQSAAPLQVWLLLGLVREVTNVQLTPFFHRPGEPDRRGWSWERVGGFGHVVRRWLNRCVRPCLHAEMKRVDSLTTDAHRPSDLSAAAGSAAVT